MAKPIPDYLKLHREESSLEPADAQATDQATVDFLCQAFERATGWSLRYEPATASHLSGEGASAAENGAGLILSPAKRGDGAPARVPRQQVEHLAAAIAITLGELESLRAALRQREAELAAGVPVAARPDEAQHLAERLEAALEAGVRAVGGDAAALYLLDEATSQLKLRACYGLPQSRLLDEPRPLRGAVADLEALIGHAVVIEDTTLLPHWRCPEEVPSAMCVPVSTPNTPLGTLWVYSQSPRDFTPEQTNVVEVVAGRIASDLEREMLLTHGDEARSLQRELEEAWRWQEERLPSVAPLLDDWDVAGVAQSQGSLAGEFYDWSILADGSLAVALGDAHGRGLSAGLSATALHAALKAHEAYRHDARKLILKINDTLWSSSPGGQYASLGYALILPERGSVEYAGAGRMLALVVSPEGFTRLRGEESLLGGDPDLTVTAASYAVPPQSVLLLASDGVLASCAAGGEPWNAANLATFVQRHLHLSARELVGRLSMALEPTTALDRTLLVVKRIR